MLHGIQQMPFLQGLSKSGRWIQRLLKEIFILSQRPRHQKNRQKLEIYRQKYMRHWTNTTNTHEIPIQFRNRLSKIKSKSDTFLKNTIDSLMSNKKQWDSSIFLISLRTAKEHRCSHTNRQQTGSPTTGWAQAELKTAQSEPSSMPQKNQWSFRTVDTWLATANSPQTTPSTESRSKLKNLGDWSSNFRCAVWSTTNRNQTYSNDPSLTYIHVLITSAIRWYSFSISR